MPRADRAISPGAEWITKKQENLQSRKGGLGMDGCPSVGSRSSDSEEWDMPKGGLVIESSWQGILINTTWKINS